MESLWRRQEKFSEVKAERVSPGKKNIHRDVIVIGAGMAGLLTAYYLHEQGKNVLVIEADKTASGQTERTTAKITSQHGLKYARLIKKAGLKKAKMYAQANEAAIKEYERLIKKEKIECQFEKAPAYLYSLQNVQLLKEEAEAAVHLGIKAFFTKETELPFPVAGAVCFKNQALFSPLEFVNHISSGLEILENTMVTAIRGKRVMTEGQEYTADKIVIATHYPMLNVPGFYFLRQHQERSCVLALTGCDKIKGMYYGIDRGGFSFRQAGNVLLFGGGTHRTGENISGGSYELLERAAKQYFPECKTEMRWSAQDCMPHDGIPFIGKYSFFTPDIYVATGFQKWGMTSSMIAALLLRDELCGMDNPYKRLFSPQRINLRAAAKNLLSDIIISTKGLIKGFFHIPGKTAELLENGHGGIVRIAGKRYACYKDEEGCLHKFSARCPHMGCELTWNPDEKSWDCPCHGSRFDVDGRVLDNPAGTGVAGR